MIIFDGYLTGDAKHFCINKLLNNFSVLLIITFLFTVPLWAFLSSQVGALVEMMVALTVFILFSPLIFRVAVTKKERQRNVPKKVILNEDVITVISDKSVYSKSITQIKKVYDYGDFYYLELPKRYVDNVFVCQKDLLSMGTIENFELLFKGKIDRKNIRSL